MDENITAQLAARDRLRKKLALLRTPEQRMAEMARLQKVMWVTLRSSPDGYRHFLRRNFKARAISQPITSTGEFSKAAGQQHRGERTALCLAALASANEARVGTHQGPARSGESPGIDRG